MIPIPHSSFCKYQNQTRNLFRIKHFVDKKEEDKEKRTGIFGFFLSLPNIHNLETDISSQNKLHAISNFYSFPFRHKKSINIKVKHKIVPVKRSLRSRFVPAKDSFRRNRIYYRNYITKPKRFE